jgi:hypothetical protein
LRSEFKFKSLRLRVESLLGFISRTEDGIIIIIIIIMRIVRGVTVLLKGKRRFRALEVPRPCPFVLILKVKVKQSHYRPGQALSFPGG